jgi:hypothetical protein
MRSLPRYLCRRFARPLLAGLLLAGCHEGAPPPPPAAPTAPDAPPAPADAPFLALYVDEASGVARAAAPGGAEEGRSFYLGVRRDALGERWFLSAYLKQLYPGAVGRAGTTLGTRVVSFRVQNDTLFVFDVDDRKKASETFDPDVVVEAYPLIAPGRLGPGLDDYVVFDPGAGRNRVSVLNDGEFDGKPYYPSPLEVDLTYAQNARTIDDGITFEQVFTGHFRDPDQVPDRNGLEPNAYRASGTLGLALRRYREGEGFAPKVLPRNETFFFNGPPRSVPNKRLADRPVARWNLAPGGPPIVWRVSPGLARVQAERYPEYDLVGAVKRGVEAWNAVFGFEALRAEEAAPEQSFADDDVNYLLFDENLTAGFAFADWRLNPNTGEIRGASVYFPEVFVDAALDIFAPGDGGRAPASGRDEAPARVAWGPFEQDHLCALAPGRSARGVGRAGAAAGDDPSTVKENVERFITHVVAHEIGHTLGLRHNFKGSLVPPSSSVMDYLPDEDAAAVPGPGAYDVDAVRYLYGLAPEPPAQPFCNDEGVATDPDCNRGDAGADPLAGTLVATYRALLEAFVHGEFEGFEDVILAYDVPTPAGDLFDYLRAADDPARQAAAWEAAFAPLRAPLDPSFSPALVGLWTRRLLEVLLIDPAVDARLLDVKTPLALDAQFTPQLAEDLRAVVVDGGAIYGVEARGTAVDALKRLRDPAALVALLAAREAIAAAATSLAGDDRAVAEDVLRRIDRATDPYFD